VVKDRLSKIDKTEWVDNEKVKKRIGKVFEAGAKEQETKNLSNEQLGNFIEEKGRDEAISYVK
jgi:hypothetical protein